MNIYTLACAILALGVFLAVLMWSVPKVRQTRQVRAFRGQLGDAEAITSGWRQWLLEHDPSDEVPAPTPPFSDTDGTDGAEGVEPAA